MGKPPPNCSFCSFARLPLVEISSPAFRVILYSPVVLSVSTIFPSAKMSDSVIKCRVCFSRIHTFRECPQLKRRTVIRAPIRISSSVDPDTVRRVLSEQPQVVLQKSCILCLRSTCTQQRCLVDDVLPVSTLFFKILPIKHNT